MKKIIAAAFVLALAPLCASAAGKYELGLIVGEPTGISAKTDLAGGGAVAAAVAWSFSGEDRLTLHADRLWYKYGVLKVSQGRLPLYYGIGGRLKLEDKSKAGVRFPVGLQYFFSDVRFTAFGEIVPILNVAPDTDVDVAVAVGFRVIF